VSLSGPARALRILPGHDLVVLCPSLTEGERCALERACRRARTPVVPLVDEPGREQPLDLKRLLARTLPV